MFLDVLREFFDFVFSVLCVLIENWKSRYLNKRRSVFSLFFSMIACDYVSAVFHSRRWSVYRSPATHDSEEAWDFCIFSFFFFNEQHRHLTQQVRDRLIPLSLSLSFCTPYSVLYIYINIYCVNVYIHMYATIHVYTYATIWVNIHVYNVVISLSLFLHIFYIYIHIYIE